MDYAFEFIINNGGIDTDEDYPYRAVDGKCDQNRKNAKVVSIDDYEDVPAYDEGALQKAVANQVIAVAVEGGGREFQLYDSGVFTGRCGTALDHGVAVVGYGTEKGVKIIGLLGIHGVEAGEKPATSDSNVTLLQANQASVELQSSHLTQSRMV